MLGRICDKVVFVGNAESALIDQEDSFRTVFRRSDGLELSGVEVAATAFANLALIRTLRRSFILDLAVILSVGVLACLLSFHSAMLLFEQARWSQAVRAFGALLDDFPEDGPIRYFLDRAEKNEREGVTWDSPIRLNVK